MNNIEIKNNSKTEVPVALFFFNRPQSLKKVFEAIRFSRPSKLFLIQDGARINNENDIQNIKACREIVERVDWECEVHKNFSKENMSCDHRIFTGISWAFQYVDRLVILEDDCLPSQSFLPFCKEVLDKYKDDLRINMISGMNYLDEFNETENSYFFSNTAAGWGWATWKRSWNIAVEEKNFDFLTDRLIKKMVSDCIKKSGLKINVIQGFISKAEKIRNKNLETLKVNSWEYAIGASMLLSSSMIITPKKNLISNIGLTEDSTHAVNSIKKLDKATQKLFFKKTYDLDFPLKHPKYVIRNFQYEKEHKRIVGSNSFINLLRRIESFGRRFYYSNVNERRDFITKLLKIKM